MLYLFFSLAMLAQQQQTLTMSADAEATVEVDGNVAGVVQPGTTLTLQVAPGDHRVTATCNGAASPVWRKSILVSSALPATLVIPMRSHVIGAEIQKRGFWRDERTGLLWAASDSGSGVTVSQAHSYCRQLSAGGLRDWRLPDIDELQILYQAGAAADDRGFRLVAPLKLTGWSWSATRGNEAAENWTLDLGDGARASVAAGDAGLNRALCVRSESK